MLDNLDEILVEMLARAYSGIIYNEEKFLKDMIGESLSVKEMHTVEVIYTTMKNRQNTAGSIARRLGITLGTCTTNIDRLVAKGLVNKIKNEKDRRIVYIELTEKGIQAYLKHVAMHKKIIIGAINKLSASEKVALFNAINKLEI